VIPIFYFANNFFTHNVKDDWWEGEIMNIKKLCIPSKESGTHQLMQGTLPGHADPDTQTIHVSPEMLKQLEALETVLAYLPESYLTRGSSALQIS
jgi:hypothetical protein